MQEQARCSNGPVSADNSDGPSSAQDAHARWEPGEWNSPEHAEQEARRMFATVLQGWAMDVLRLQSLGLHVPGHHEAIAA